MRSRSFCITVLIKGAVLTALVFTLLGLSGCGKDSKDVPEGGPAAGGPRRIQDELYREVEITSDLGAYEIEYFSGSEIPRITAPVEETDEPFRIIDFGPETELPAEVEYPSVYVVFSQPVVPIGRLGRPEGSSNIMRIDPPLRGTYRWYGTRLLSFDAEEPVPPQRVYRVSVNPDVTSLGGKNLSGDNAFSFRTEYLSIRNFAAGPLYAPASDIRDVPPEKADTAVLEFSYPVNLDVIRNYISVSAGDRGIQAGFSRPADPEGRYLPEELSRMVRIKLENGPPENTEITVAVRKGARSEADYLGIPETVTRSYNTLKPFSFRGYDTYSWSFPRSTRGDSKPVYFEFTHPVDPEGLAGMIHTMPAVPIGNENIEVWENTVKLNGLPVEHEKKYLFFFDAGVKDSYGRSLGTGTEAAVTIPPAERYAYFPNTGSRMLEAGFPPRIVWEYQNVFSGVWKAGPIEDPYKPFSDTRLEPYDFSGKERNERYIEAFDFSEWLNSEGKGWVGFSWNFAEKNSEGERPAWAKRDLQLQVTDLGVTVRHGYNRIIAWVTSLSSGRPVENASVSILREQSVKETRTTGADGLAVFELEPGEYARYFGNPDSYWDNSLRLRVRKDGDVIEYMPNSSHNTWRNNVWNTVYPVRAGGTRGETYLFTDRGLYKPGETVTYRGIDRDLQYGRYTAYKGRYSVTAREARYQGAELAAFDGATSGSGGFYGSFRIPEDAEPGQYEIVYTRDGGTRRISFQVANFRRTGFFVSAGIEQDSYLQGEEPAASVTAEYLSGGTVRNGTYELYWSKTGTAFLPPEDKYTEYRFGPDRYGTRFGLSADQGDIPAGGTVRAAQKTTTDGVPGLPYRYILEARISDVSNQIVADEASVIVHPASFYIGGRIRGSSGTEYTFLEQGTEAVGEFTLIDPAGTEISPAEINGAVKAELYRVSWRLARQQGVAGRINSRWERVDELEFSLEASPGESEISFVPKQSGRYYLKLSAEDASGRTAVTDVPFYSTGAGWVRWGGLDEDQIDLKPDKPLYSPGDTAKILVQSPLPEGEYLLTLEREGIIDEQIISIEGSSRLIEIPVKEEYLPIVYASLCSYTVRTGEPEHDYFSPDLDKPKGLFGITPIRVDTDTKVLDVSIDPVSEIVTPGTRTEMTITVLENGLPAEHAEVAFLAVDRGVLDLIDYHVPDPAAYFYEESRFPLGVEGGDSRSLLIDPVTYEVTDLLGGGGDDGKAMAETARGGIQERSDFRATAVFEPFLTTGEDGTVMVEFELPDTLTSYRCTAVAAKDDAFGIGEEEVQARNPLNIRTAFPRRMRVRDTALGSVIITNLSGEGQECTVSVDAEVITVGKSAEKTVTVPPEATIDIPFELQARRTGKAFVHISTVSPVHSEQLTVGFPVEQPRVFESVTAVGKTSPSRAAAIGTETAEEGLVLPPLAGSGEGSLSLTLAGSRIGTLDEAVQYLLEYPYGCMEQRASRLLPLVLFAGEAEAFLFESAEDSDIDPAAAVYEELGRWGDFQLPDGGFPFWPEAGRESSSYYATLRAAHLVRLAELNGFTIPDSIERQGLMNYLADPPGHVRASDYLMLYSIYVRALFGGIAQAEADRYFAQGDSVGLSGYGFLGLTYRLLGRRLKAEECLTRMKQFARPGTRTVDLTETYENTPYFYDSGIEKLALYLLNYLEFEPQSGMVARLVTTILQRQKSGLWRNTSDTNWALLSLAEVRKYEEPDIDFTAAVDAGEMRLFEEAVNGPSEIIKAEIPVNTGFKDAARGEIIPLKFTAEGRGTLYYTAVLKYSLPAEILSARDEGIGLHTAYFDSKGGQVEGNELIAGETYRVKVYVSTARRRNFLAVRVPIPSGAEVLDTSFVTVPSYTEDAYSPFRSHSMKIYDNEVQFFWDDFPAGRQHAEFLVRTTSAGVFPTPPAVGECMYEPEVFGRTEGKLYIIKRR